LIFSKNQLHLIFRTISWLLEFVQVFQLAFWIFGFSVGFRILAGYQLAFEIFSGFQLAFGIFRVFSWHCSISVGF